MKLRLAAALVLLAVAFGIVVLIYAFGTRYYFVAAFADAPIVQVWPFRTKDARERVRVKIVQALVGGKQMPDAINQILPFTVRVPSRSCQG